MLGAVVGGRFWSDGSDSGENMLSSYVGGGLGCREAVAPPRSSMGDGARFTGPEGECFTGTDR